MSKYLNRTKKQWRGWCWNRMVELVEVPPIAATVAYLRGDTDADLLTATRKGFLSANVIAVDQHDSNVKAARRSHVGIKATIEDLLPNWPAEYPCHGIIADYCGGLSWDRFMSVPECFMTSTPCTSISGRAIIINLLRGRDDGARCATLLGDQWATSRHKTPPKHRGGIIFESILDLVFYWTMYDSEAAKNPDIDIDELIREMTRKRIRDPKIKHGMSDDLCEYWRLRPSFYSYRSESSGQYFDSVAFWLPWTRSDDPDHRANETTRRKLIALRARRTVLARSN